VWGIRVLVLAGLAATLLAAPARRITALEPVALGADGSAHARPRALQVAVLALGAAALTVAPALEGHSATLSPVTLLTIDDTAHVAAMCAWLGGLAAFVALVPRATRALEAPDRARLLSALLRRFSPVALGAVAVLAATGTLQAIPYLTALDQLWTTGYGRELLAKIVLLAVLAGLGALNRQRTLPALARLAQAGRPAGAVGHVLRRTLRAEVALLVAVLGVTAALVDGVPPVAAASGPFNGEAKLGATIDLDLTVDPARPGANQVHLYLLRARDGAPYTGTKELTVTARQKDKGIGPLPVHVHRAGPGHYTADTVQLVPDGTWTLTITDRYSDFDEVSTQVDVPVR
jgi:copper transport protein